MSLRYKVPSSGKIDKTNIFHILPILIFMYVYFTNMILKLIVDDALHFVN